MATVRVAVIVDDLNPDMRRLCFWDEQLSALPGVEYELVSLLDHMAQRKFFDVYQYNVIIFNWCVLDGAVMFASDRIRAIVRFYDDHFTQFVRNGGILVMENQPRRWRPIQDAYDTLLHGAVKVLRREPPPVSESARVSSTLHKHPLVHNLPLILKSAYAHSNELIWFPPGSTSRKSLQEQEPRKIYSGAFRSWRGDWLPLIYTEDETYPIMLAKTDELGLWVVTTMFLASSNIKILIENLVVDATRNMKMIQQYHERYRLTRTLRAVRAFVILAVAGVAVYVALATHLITANLPISNSLAGNIAISLLITALVWVLNLLRTQVWRSIRMALNR